MQLDTKEFEVGLSDAVDKCDSLTQKICDLQTNGSFERLAALSATVYALEIGSEVSIGEADNRISGKILGVSIDAKGLEYHVSWWNGRSRVTEWLKECEVTSAEPPALKIGFGQ